MSDQAQQAQQAQQAELADKGYRYMNLKVKRLLKAIVFFCIFVSLFYVTAQTLRFKDQGILQMEAFYRYDDNSLDVILIGSSHVGVNIDPEILLEEYGIKGYNLWAPVQPAWNSYYFLKEALKTQSPELICVETAIMTQELEYSDYARAIANTMGMKFSKDKIEAIQVSVGEELQRDFIMEWPAYHARYTDLNEKDFKYYFWNYDIVGGKIDSGYGIHVNEEPIVISQESSIPLYEKQELYLRKIIELCKEDGVPLLLFTTPYTASEQDQLKFNRIAQITAEYGDGVIYKNFLEDIDAIPVNFETDYADGGGHFNNYGIEKFTMYYGRYLKDNFNITVRNEEYANKFNLQKLYSCAYRLREVFTGDAAGSYADTGQALYDDPDRSWTLLADFDTAVYGNDQVYFACYAEEPGAYRGLLVKRENDKLYIILGDNYYVETIIPEEGYVRMAITRKDSVYNVYINGEKTAENITTSCAGYEGTLVLGCELDENLNPFRFSAATIYEMEVYNEVISEKDVMHWLLQERTSAELMQLSVQESVAYHLEQEFAGDGIEQYLDTEVKLYDTPMRNWTLLTELDLTCDKSSTDLVFLSCFNEDTDNYRGLLIRYRDGKIETILGNTYYVDIPDSGNDSMKIAIVKEGSSYTIYADGQVIASDLSSYCAAYMGNLLLGCQEKEGIPIRLSPVTVRKLEIYDEIMSGDEIMAW